MAQRLQDKKKAILERIKQLEEGIAKCNAYLESGKNADWSGFHPVFTCKMKDGKILPPHKDWVRSRIIPWLQRELGQGERAWDRLSDAAR